MLDRMIEVQLPSGISYASRRTLRVCRCPTMRRSVEFRRAPVSGFPGRRSEIRLQVAGRPPRATAGRRCGVVGRLL